jgi:hypothetical protein
MSNPGICGVDADVEKESNTGHQKDEGATLETAAFVIPSEERNLVADGRPTADPATIPTLKQSKGILLLPRKDQNDR